MLDTKRLLDQFLGGQMARDGRTMPSGSGGGLGDLARQALGGSLGSGLGGAGGGGLGGLGGGIGGIGGALGNLSNNQVLGGGLAALLLGSRQGRRLGGSAMKVGGMALVGALAYNAYQNWQKGQQPAAVSAGPDTPVLPAPIGTPFSPASEADQQSLGRMLLRAMIAAAKADGHVDAEEQKNIFAEMDKLDLDSDDKAFVMDELRAPLDVDAVARAARTPEEASEIYTASLLAISVDSQAERDYLAGLAARLKLDPGLVAHLHATVEGATQQA